MKKPIGQKLSPILNEIEETLWENEYFSEEGPPGYTVEGFRSSVKIFMSAIMDKMWEFQLTKNMTLDEKAAEAEAVGNAIRNLILEHTNIDTHELYK